MNQSEVLTKKDFIEILNEFGNKLEERILKKVDDKFKVFGVAMEKMVDEKIDGIGIIFAREFDRHEKLIMNLAKNMNDRFDALEANYNPRISTCERRIIALKNSLEQETDTKVAW